MFPRLRSLITRQGMSRSFQACYFESWPPASNAQLKSLLDSVPWLPSEYVEFLATTNGCVLEFFIFYGLGVDHPFPSDQRQRIIESYGRDQWFAVGHDCAGDVIAINKSGVVATAGSDPPPDQPIPLCKDFRSMIEDICCGQGYSDYFNGDVENSEWFGLIKSLGWAN